jgi:hypothetical protein
MNACDGQRERSIARAAESLGLGTKALSRSRWRIAGENGDPVIDLGLDDTWLACSTRVAPASMGADLWSALVAGHALPGMCKPCIEPRGRQLDARVDVPLLEGAGLEDACRQALRDLVSARRTLLGVRDGPDGVQVRPEEAPLPSPAVGPLSGLLQPVVDACADAQWPVIERTHSGLRVDLTGARGPRHAKIEAFGTESCRVHVRIGSAKRLSPLSRTAAAGLLLEVNRAVRFARAGVADSGDRVEFFGEVWVRERPTSALFDHAFCALALVYRLCSMELRVIADEAIAREYVRARGFSPRERAPAPQGEAATS